jgi:hypothetical protein
MKNNDSNCVANTIKIFKYHGKILTAPRDIYLTIKRPIWRKKKSRQRAAKNPEKKIVALRPKVWVE